MPGNETLNIILNLLQKGKGGEDTKKDLGGVEKAARAAGAALLSYVSVESIKATFELAQLGAQSLRTKSAFEAISGGSELAAANLDAMKIATRGAMSETEMMAVASRMLQMGLVDSADGLGKMTEMATRLGSAMGMEAGPAMENWNLMIANQSIPRLDSYGISGAKVRQRIIELQAATEGMSREQAFMTATMEEGEAAMARLGPATDDAMLSFERAKATAEDLKTEFAEGLAPAAATVLDAVKLLVTWNSQIEDAQASHAEEVANTADNYEDYVAELNRAAGVTGMYIDEQGDLVKIQLSGSTVIKKLVQANFALTESMFEVNQMVAAGITESDGWMVQMEAARDATAELAEEEARRAERMLDSTDVMNIYTSALGESELSTQRAAAMTDVLSASLGIMTTAQEQAQMDAELLAQGYTMGVVTLGEFKSGMESAADGTLVLSDAERGLIETQIGASASARDLAAASAEAAQEAGAQAQNTMDLAASLKDATSGQIASRLTGMLDPEKMGADAYGEAVSQIGLTFGTMDETSIALAENMGALAGAIEDGVIPTEDADEALRAFIEDAQDGQVDIDNLVGEFSDLSTEAAGAGTGLRDAAGGMDSIAMSKDEASDALDAIGTSAGNAAGPVGDFASQLGTTEGALMALVSGSPWTFSVTGSTGVQKDEIPDLNTFTGGGGTTTTNSRQFSSATTINNYITDPMAAMVALEEQRRMTAHRIQSDF